MRKTFLRRTWHNFSRLGRGRKKKLKWRNPNGRHNKMRNKMKGYPKVVSVGYKKPKSEKPFVIYNLKELEKVNHGTVIVGKVGKKKRNELIKAMEEKKLKILNKPRKVSEEKI